MNGKESERTDKQIRIEKIEKKNKVAAIFAAAAFAMILFQWLDVFDIEFLVLIAIVLIFVALILYQPDSYQEKRKSKGHIIAIVSMIPIFFVASFILLDVEEFMSDFRANRVRNQLVELVPDYVEVGVRASLANSNFYHIEFEVSVEYLADVNFGKLTLSLVEDSRNILHEISSFEGDREGYSISVVAEATNELILLDWSDGDFENSRLTFSTNINRYPFGDLYINFGIYWELSARSVRHVHLSLLDEFIMGSLRAKEIDELLSSELSMEINVHQILDIEEDAFVMTWSGIAPAITAAQFHSHSMSVRFPAYRSLRYFADDIAQIQDQIAEILAEQGIDVNLDTDWFQLSPNPIRHSAPRTWEDYTGWIEIAGATLNELYVLSENAISEMINEELSRVLDLEVLLLEHLDFDILELRLLPIDTDPGGEPIETEMNVNILMASLPEDNAEVEEFLYELGFHVNEILIQNDEIFRSLSIYLPEDGWVESFHRSSLEE